MYKIFELKNFRDGQVPIAMQVSTGFNDDFKDSDIHPIATFVYNKKYFFVVLKKSFEYIYLDLDSSFDPQLESINQYMLEIDIQETT